MVVPADHIESHVSEQDYESSLYERDSANDFDSTSEMSEAYSHTSMTQRLSNPSHILSAVGSSARALRRLTMLFASPPLSKAPGGNPGEGKDIELHPSAYLDGMRGFAAFVVFLCHLSYTTWDIGHTYMAAEPGQESQNTSLLQLPFIRLFYSGPPMVAIFFIISGYALSYKPLKQIHNRNFSGLLSTLTSSTFRRPFRLFLPCLASSLIVVILTRLGLYKMTEDFANNMRGFHEDHYQTASSIEIQLVDWFWKVLNFVNIFDWSIYNGSFDLDRHLWTIPVEFRCSLALFMTHILVARMTRTARMTTIGFLMVYGTFANRPDFVPFLAGFAIAELDLMQLESPFSFTEKVETTTKTDISRGRSLRKITAAALLVGGLYLASYPDIDGHISPGYITLTFWIPNRYTEKHRFWPNIGAMMVVYGVSRLEGIKSIFKTRPLQYLGKISFPLYVCHGFVIHTFGYSAMKWIYDATDAWEDRILFIRGYLVAAVLTIVVTIWVSDLFLRVIDTRAVRFARWLESRVLTQS